MSGPYDNYNSGYQSGPPYNGGAPFNDPGYGNQQGGYAPPPEPTYGGGQQHHGHHNPQSGYATDNTNFGPPAQGGFQHGQQPNAGAYAAYEQSGGQQPGAWGNPEPSNQYPQTGAYNADPNPADPNNPGGEQDRGLMGALAGGAAGYYGGGKAGHSFLGAIAGAWGGSKLEDAYKNREHNQGQQQGYPPQGGYGGQQGYGQPPPQGGHHHKHHHQSQQGGW